jgi:hypothetical protein
MHPELRIIDAHVNDKEKKSKLDDRRSLAWKVPTYGSSGAAEEGFNNPISFLFCLLSPAKQSSNNLKELNNHVRLT